MNAAEGFTLGAEAIGTAVERGLSTLMVESSKGMEEGGLTGLIQGLELVCCSASCCGLCFGDQCISCS